MSARPDAKRKRRIDLSVAQVASTALGAVGAAKLASSFGVYGTILGAGVVSVLATCGGSVLQAVFRRTGEQIREAAVSTRSTRQKPEQGSRAVDEFTGGTVYRARVRSWRRPVLAAAVVFGVTMAGITVYELASGDSFSGGTGTTVSNAVTGHSQRATKSPDSEPGWSPTPTTSSSGGGTSSGGAASGETPQGTTPSSGAPTDRSTTSGPATPEPRTSKASGTPAPAPSGSVTAPAPSADSGSRTASPDPVVPSLP
ncbi:hypothetical protein [Streptomyces sp. V3I7]|uniref:hypothetical protein n=1 Tax=Streptomyces sp. V3I7 TaxID=3042278 RepID=UPI002786C364|nr:hypothetical protein [Streptomyces sp. V3I7]MDQ0993518.1 hypothetical protein [Streptomyces sp. V3I7]